MDRLPEGFEMTCTRATQIDIDEFLVSSAVPAFDDFRSHFLSCAECAEAVERWTQIDLAIREKMVELHEPPSDRIPGHPEPELLEAFRSHRESLGAEAMKIERHIEMCVSCQTEMAVLSSFQKGLLGAIEPNTQSGARVRVPGAIEPDTDWLLSQTRRLFGSVVDAIPQFAPAVVVVAAVWWGASNLSLVTPGGPSSPEAHAVAKHDDSETSPETDSVLPSSPPSSPPAEALAAKDGFVEPGPKNESTRSEASALDDAIEGGNSVPSGSLAHLDKDSDSATSAQRGSEQSEQEIKPFVVAKNEPDASENPGNRSGLTNQANDEILLAALTELPLPRYAAPLGGGSVGWMAQFGAVRAASGSATVESRAPADHVGLTLSSAPRLWWSVDRPTDLSVQITVVNDDELKPIIRKNLAGPFDAGLHAVDLSDLGVRLATDVEYRWFVSVLVDPNRPSRNPISAGSIRVLGSDDPRREMLGDAPDVERGHALARAGIWYDAYDFFAAVAGDHPEMPPVVRHRDYLDQLTQNRP